MFRWHADMKEGHTQETWVTPAKFKKKKKRKYIIAWGFTVLSEKSYSTEGDGSQPGSFLVSDTGCDRYMAGLAGSYWECRYDPCVFDHISGSSYDTRPDLTRLVYNIYVYHNQAKKSKWPVQEAQIMIMGEWRVWARGYVQKTVPVCLQGYACVFPHPPPISHKKPKLSNNMPQL